MADCEALRLHYVYTLTKWYERFTANHDEIVRLADERFYRLYAFYLAGAMTMFSDGGMVVYQLQYLRSRYAAPITRDYMLDTERRLAADVADLAPQALRGPRRARLSRARVTTSCRNSDRRVTRGVTVRPPDFAFACHSPAIVGSRSFTGGFQHAGQ